VSDFSSDKILLLEDYRFPIPEPEKSLLTRQYHTTLINSVTMWFLALSFSPSLTLLEVCKTADLWKKSWDYGLIALEEFMQSLRRNIIVNNVALAAASKWIIKSIRTGSVKGKMVVSKLSNCNTSTCIDSLKVSAYITND